MPKAKFTDRTVNSLKLPDHGRRDFYDTDRASPKGFGVRLSHTGTRTFFLKYVDRAGKQRRTLLGEYPAVSLAEARDTGMQLRKERPATGGRHGAQPVTFQAMADRYVEEYAKAKKKSWREDRRIFVKYFAEWDNRSVAEITRAEVVARLQDIKHAHGPIQANRCLAVLRKAINFTIANPAEGTILLEANPAVLVDAPGEERALDRVFNKTEIRKLWKAFDQMGAVGAIFQLQLATGARIAEVRGLAEKELEGDHWTLPAARSKNGLTHVVPLNAVAVDVLDRQREANRVLAERLADKERPFEGERWMFPSPTGNDNAVWIGRKPSKKVRKLSKVDDFRSHHLRRTCATRLTQLGFPRFIADRVLNHVDRTVGGRYDRNEYLKEKAEALDAWGRWLAETVGLSTNVVQLEQRPA